MKYLVGMLIGSALLMFFPNVSALHGYCSQPPNVQGSCYENIKRWYYDKTIQTCKPFIYRGCGGNGNNFSYKKICEGYCVSTKECFFIRCNQNCKPVCGNNGKTYTNMCYLLRDRCLLRMHIHVIGHKPCPSSYVCKLPKLIGPCTRNLGRYYFNAVKGKCFKFFYGGCKGNGNNFKTLHDCQSKCIKYSKPKNNNNKIELVTKGDKRAKDLCQIRPIGCYHDSQHKRPLPFLLASYRDFTSHVFHGLMLNWNKYQMSLERMVYDCAQRTKAKGYSHFGIQYYGECWSGPSIKHTGHSDTCVNGKQKPCKKGELCSGGGYTNFIYSIVSRLSCKAAYRKVGCFYDPLGDRPFPYLLETHRDTMSHVHRKHTIKWTNYKKSLETLVCICAQRAKARGFKFFAIQYYGECWSGPYPKKAMKKSTICVNTKLKPCDPAKDCTCAGEASTNFVYERV